MKMKKITAAILTLAMLAGCFGGCGTQNASTGNTSEQVNEG